MIFKSFHSKINPNQKNINHGAIDCTSGSFYSGPFPALILGLILAQIIATLHVYFSNIQLQNSLFALKGSKYLAVPNEIVSEQLHTFFPAFMGGIFFTFTIGAGLSLLSAGAAWLWKHTFSGHSVFLGFILVIWSFFIFLINIEGINILPSCYFIFIPPFVFITAAKGIAKQKKVLTKGLFHVLPVILLALLWFTQIDSNLFINIRDSLLLSNRAGTAISNFYYKYALYPAEALKSLDQKMIRTFNISQDSDPLDESLLRQKLERNDYLAIGREKAADLELEKRGEELILHNRGKKILTTSIRTIYHDTEKVLRDFSRKAYRQRFFRSFTYFSFLIGFPLTIYLLVLYLLSNLLSVVFGRKNSLNIASCICFCLALLFFFIFYSTAEKKVKAGNLDFYLSSGNWKTRAEALQKIETQRLDLARYPHYVKLIKSPFITDRYWLARALAFSKGDETLDSLLSLVEDPQPLVVSKALSSLGRRGNSRVLSIIIQKLKTSDHWYVQWHSYKAMKELGWRQVG